MCSLNALPFCTTKANWRVENILMSLSLHFSYSSYVSLMTLKASASPWNAYSPLRMFLTPTSDDVKALWWGWVNRCLKYSSFISVSVVSCERKDSYNEELFIFNCKKCASPSGRAVCGTYVSDRTKTGFESCSRHGCMSAVFCVVLSCVGRILAMDPSPVQGIL